MHTGGSLSDEEMTAGASFSEAGSSKKKIKMEGIDNNATGLEAT